MKPKAALFSFGNCSYCNAQIQNARKALEKIVDFQCIEDSNFFSGLPISNFDFACITGIATSQHDIDFLKKIRENTKIVIAVGFCATSSDYDTIRSLLQSSKTLKNDSYGSCLTSNNMTRSNFTPLNSHIFIDHFVFGCPFTQAEFVKVIKTLVFGTTPDIPNYPVCVECKMQGNECLFVKQQDCLGLVSRAGCNAVCPTTNLSCIGCRGLAPGANVNAMQNILIR